MQTYEGAYRGPENWAVAAHARLVQRPLRDSSRTGRHLGVYGCRRPSWPSRLLHWQLPSRPPTNNAAWQPRVWIHIALHLPCCTMPAATRITAPPLQPTSLRGSCVSGSASCPSARLSAMRKSPGCHCIKREGSAQRLSRNCQERTRGGVAASQQRQMQQQDDCSQ